MFATGSHDGAIRIWTRPADIGDDPDEIVRASSPFYMDDLERTDSPFTQQDFDEGVNTMEVWQADSGPSIRERVVAFVSERSGEGDDASDGATDV